MLHIKIYIINQSFPLLYVQQKNSNTFTLRTQSIEKLLSSNKQQQQQKNAYNTHDKKNFFFFFNILKLNSNVGHHAAITPNGRPFFILHQSYFHRRTMTSYIGHFDFVKRGSFVYVLKGRVCMFQNAGGNIQLICRFNIIYIYMQVYIILYQNQYIVGAKRYRIT